MEFEKKNSGQAHLKGFTYFNASFFITHNIALNKLFKILFCTHFTFSRVDTVVEMEVAYSCSFLAVSESSTCPDIGTSWCHAGIIEYLETEIIGFKMTPYYGAHRFIRESKIKRAWMLLQSTSNQLPWLKNSKIVFKKKCDTLLLRWMT